MTLEHHQCFVDGKWVDSADKATYPVHNPATSQLIQQVSDSGIPEVLAAIDAAESAFNSFSTLLASERSALLMKWHDLILENKEGLANLATQESGKPIKEMRGELDYSASFIRFYAAEAERVYGDIIPTPFTQKQLMVQKKPIGVCAVITPWNFPFAMIARKAAPALAAGCTIIIKPAESTPLSALALAALAKEAGFPDGVINVLPASHGQTVGQALCENDRVRKLSFTGSTPVGKKLYAQSANTLKRLSLELGGNAPFIVFDDADIDKAVTGAIQSRYRNAGQTCVCANRFYIHSAIYDQFAEKITQSVKALKVGNGLEETTDIGPLINEAAIEKVGQLVNSALEQGAVCLTGGKRLNQQLPFFNPTVLSQVTQDMTITQTEIFGPVVTLIPFETESEVIQLANGTEYGLAAYLFTQQVGRPFRMAQELAFGMLGVNTGMISTANAPFGGVKASGLGREGSYQGIEEYLDTQYVCLDIAE